MRLLGVLGGMSWTSTAEYYRLLNQTGIPLLHIADATAARLVSDGSPRGWAARKPPSGRDRDRARSW